MRTLPSELNTAVGKRITQPVYFIQLGFATPLRYTTGPSLDGDTSPSESWDGNDWTHENIRVSRHKAQRTGRHQLSIEWGTSDAAVLSVILNDGVAGRAITVYVSETLDALGKSVYAAADVITYFVGQMDVAGLVDGRASIACMSEAEHLFLPNKFVDLDQGFNHITFPGTRTFGGIRWEFS